MAIQVNLRLHEDLYERVEEARGGRSRNGFVVRALEAALAGTGGLSPAGRSEATASSSPQGAPDGATRPESAPPRTSEQPTVTPYESRKGAEKPCRRCKAGIVRFGKCSNCGTAGYA